MRRIDFMITYEVKGRELDYLTLLLYELKKRGYNVALESANALFGKMTKYNAEVIITAGMRLSKINSGNGVLFNKALELTPEQVDTNEWKHKVEERDEIRKCVVVNAWGEKFRETLIKEQKMPQSRVVVYGHPAMDFCKKRFDSFFLDRNELAAKYSINPDIEWNLFISSFTLGAMGEQGVQEYDRLHGTAGTYKLYLAEQKTIEELIDWFNKALSDRRDGMIIYRPHPVEKIDKRWIELEKKYDNFRVIRGENVKQWIKVCNRVYSWISTSTVEAYYMGKPTILLRPVEIESAYDVEIFKHPQRAISSCGDFLCSLNLTEKDDKRCVFDDSISEYYRFESDEYTYEKLADLCEEIYKKSEYTIPIGLRKELYRNNIEYWKSMSTFSKLKTCMRGLPLYKWYYALSSKRIDCMLTRRDEIKSILKRIESCVES